MVPSHGPTPWSHPMVPPQGPTSGSQSHFSGMPLFSRICILMFSSDVFLGNLWIFQKQPPEVFYEKSCS